MATVTRRTSQNVQGLTKLQQAPPPANTLSPPSPQEDPLLPSDELNELEIQSLYAWIDEVRLSRPKRNFTRDFSDGVNTAEIVKHFIPKLVELHNYSSANALAQKVYNWHTLNQKVFRRIDFSVSEDVIQAIVNCRPGYVEVVLNDLRKKIDEYITRQHKANGTVPYPTAAAAAPDRPTGNHYEYAPSQQRSTPPLFDAFNSQPLSGSGMAGAVDGGGARDYLGYALDRSGGRAGATSTFGSGSPRTADYPRLLQEKTRMVMELQDTVAILQIKVGKLEELLQLKDLRIEELSEQLQLSGTR